jgi:tetratricopeptide (TPR) repeat protein
VSRERTASRSSERSRQREAARPAALRARGDNTQHKNAPPLTPEKAQPDIQYQAAIKNFELGVRAFQKRNYEKAAEIFEKLAHSEFREVADRAHMHLRLCKQRVGRAAPAPKSADDYYTLGIGCLNAHQFGLAIEHLSKADRMKPHQDHIQYALAVSHSLGGNPDAAIAHLETAFTLRPENRIHARRDEDFHGLVADPRFRRLICVAG